jgi:competence protein ComEC
MVRTTKRADCSSTDQGGGKRRLALRTLTIAALVVLLFAPESIVHPSFQMSFATTLALIEAAK